MGGGEQIGLANSTSLRKEDNSAGSCCNNIQVSVQINNHPVPFVSLVRTRGGEDRDRFRRTQITSFGGLRARAKAWFSAIAGCLEGPLAPANGLPKRGHEWTRHPGTFCRVVAYYAT